MIGEKFITAKDAVKKSVDASTLSEAKVSMHRHFLTVKDAVKKCRCINTSLKKRMTLLSIHSFSAG